MEKNQTENVEQEIVKENKPKCTKKQKILVGLSAGLVLAGALGYTMAIKSMESKIENNLKEANLGYSKVECSNMMNPVCSVYNYEDKKEHLTVGKLTVKGAKSFYELKQLEKEKGKIPGKELFKHLNVDIIAEDVKINGKNLLWQDETAYKIQQTSQDAKIIKQYLDIPATIKVKVNSKENKDGSIDSKFDMTVTNGKIELDLNAMGNVKFDNRENVDPDKSVIEQIGGRIYMDKGFIRDTFYSLYMNDVERYGVAYANRKLKIEDPNIDITKPLSKDQVVKQISVLIEKQKGKLGDPQLEILADKFKESLDRGLNFSIVIKNKNKLPTKDAFIEFQKMFYNKHIGTDAIAIEIK